MLIYQGVLDTSFQKDITIMTCSCFMFRREDTFSETHRLIKTDRKNEKTKKRTGRYVAYPQHPATAAQATQRAQ
jgi:predicted oxidoreductase